MTIYPVAFVITLFSIYPDIGTDVLKSDLNSG